MWRRYQLGIYSRYVREGEGWQSHLAASKRETLSFVSRHAPQSLTILGSGWLLDIPLDQLSKLCHKIVLVDRFHPRHAQTYARQFSNVELLQCDLTGGLERIRPHKKDWHAYARSISELKPPALPPTEAVVSLNLMSQLVMPILERYATKMPPDILADSAVALETSHLTLLSRYPHWLLITDTEERHSLLANGATLPNVKTVLSPLPPLMNQRSWEWQFDTKGYYQSGHKVTLHVESGEGPST